MRVTQLGVSRPDEPYRVGQLVHLKEDPRLIGITIYSYVPNSNCYKVFVIRDKVLMSYSSFADMSDRWTLCRFKVELENE